MPSIRVLFASIPPLALCLPPFISPPLVLSFCATTPIGRYNHIGGGEQKAAHIVKFRNV